MKNHDVSSTGNLFVTVLLIGILVTLILILQRMPSSPPTVGEIKQAKGEERKLIKNSIPVVQVKGGYIDSIGSIGETIDVDIKYVEGNRPEFDVNILNEPLSVEVHR